jgi:hypothetical protein
MAGRSRRGEKGPELDSCNERIRDILSRKPVKDK